MSRLLDHILVIDIESTCWPDGPPPGQLSEIIQIGLCPLDVSSLRRLEKRSLLVQPARSQISDFCTTLTGLTPAMFADAIPFPQALRILRSEYSSKDRLWASWGDYDRRQFERQCDECHQPYPFGPGHLNIKTLFATALALPQELGLDAACQKLGLPMEGRHHRGDDDAWNIAAILALLLDRMRNGAITR